MNVRLATWFFAIAATGVCASTAHAGGKEDYRFDREYYRRQRSADAVVPPDALTVALTLRRTAADVSATVDAMQTLCQELATRFASATGGLATLQMREVYVNPTGEKKTENQRTVTVKGAVEVPLATGLDYWARARLLAQVAQVTKAIEEEMRDPKKATEVDFATPTGIVREPEQHRPELVKRWVERLRALTSAVQNPNAPLHVVRCEPPDQIEQHGYSLMAVGLSLRVQCSIEAMAGGKSP